MSSFPQDILRIIFLYSGPLSTAVARLVCKRWKNIIDSPEFKYLTENTSLCFIPGRSHPGISTEDSQFVGQPIGKELPLCRRLITHDELLHFLPKNRQTNGIPGEINMINSMYLVTNRVKMESAKQLDKQFPSIDITVITEPIQDQRNCQAELEQLASLRRQDVIEIPGSECVDILW
jgi:hypothetical protein